MAIYIYMCVCVSERVSWLVKDIVSGGLFCIPLVVASCVGWPVPAICAYCREW